MPLPQKKRGFRKIVVDSVEFNWRLNYNIENNIEVCPSAHRDNKLIVDIGWYDAWLYVDSRTVKPPAYEPKIVTPAFIRTVIEFALANSWDIANRTLTTKINYRDNKFAIV